MTESTLPPAGSKPWIEKTSQEKYNTMGSWFLGPRAENHAMMKEMFDYIVERIREGRLQYFPDDPEFITAEMIYSVDFKDSVETTRKTLTDLTEMLARHSVPFFSPRYSGHMSFDVSLPAVLGYLAAMQYNQNNVTPEASPFTSLIEWQVGQDLCEMLGFERAAAGDGVLQQSPENDEVKAWGHITCGGSIANLESMWVARNLKYYPLSLKNAMKTGAPLAFVSETFTVSLCTGEIKNFFSCNTWELLNLTPTEVVSIPGRLTAQYGISDTVLSKILEPYSIQTVGKQQLDSDFGITQPPQYLISLANHYSWPKGAAITGIGRENMIELRVDEDARLDIEHLKEELEKHLQNKRALYAVVVIIGTTEHGSVDPLDQVLELKEDMQSKGLSFMIHADAAWGGYFASKTELRSIKLPIEPEYAFSIPLSRHTNEQMACLRHVDSITIDPHKSGYNPYPAGGICYRDGRFRFLTTWDSPYLNTNDTSMGIYGVEGSKPGAAPVGVWLSLECLTVPGYAYLLGVAMLTGVKMYAHWATISLDSKSLLVTPFNRLPSEKMKRSEEEVYQERVRIRDTIVNRPNSELEKDKDALKLLHQLGSDLMINAFACNFHINGKVNTDVVEASFLNRRLYRRLSVTTMDDQLNQKPIVIMATEFSQEKYGNALITFKERLGLVGDEDLFALSNVSMSPWPTASKFLQSIMNEFQKVAEEEIKVCLVRAATKPSIHSFVIHGTSDLYLVYMGSFNVSNYRRQVIVSAKLIDDSVLFNLNMERTKNPGAIFTFHTSMEPNASVLTDLLKKKEWIGNIFEGAPKDYGTASISPPILSNVFIRIQKVVLDRSLHRSDINSSYPAKMPFYLFGTFEETNMDHILLHAPNVQLTASQVLLKLDPPVRDPAGKVLLLEDIHENLVNPFTSSHPPSFFSPARTFNVTLYNPSTPGLLESFETPISKGTVTLPASEGKLFVDYTWLNLDAATDIHIMTRESQAEVSDDINQVAAEIVRLFSQKEITWDDNVVNAIYALCPQAQKYTVSLGCPGYDSDAPSSSGTENCVVLSRFLGSESGAGRSVWQKLNLTESIKARLLQ